jgi:mitochondrial import receptor subunit TOM22
MQRASYHTRRVATLPLHTVASVAHARQLPGWRRARQQHSHSHTYIHCLLLQHLAAVAMTVSMATIEHTSMTPAATGAEHPLKMTSVAVSVGEESAVGSSATLIVDGEEELELDSEEVSAKAANSESSLSLHSLPEDDGDEEYEEVNEDEEEEAEADDATLASNNPSMTLAVMSNAQDMVEEAEELESDSEEEEDDEDDELEQETLMERLAALVDIIPPTTRVRMGRTVRRTWRSLCSTAATLGTGAWVLATASFLLLLPAALELERESMVLQHENQQRLQQQQAAQVMASTGAPAA